MMRKDVLKLQLDKSYRTRQASPKKKKALEEKTSQKIDRFSN